MKTNKKQKIFYVGKGIPKTDNARSPIRGEPNTNIDFYRKENGVFHRRRKIGKDGRATKDYDMPDVHKHSVRVHDYDSSRRKQDRAPTKRERREINKARKKRRLWQ